MRAAVALAALAALAVVSPSMADAQCVAANEVINCGHRGTGVNSAENDFAENTLPSFVYAATEGADMIELDVIHSADGVLVVIHDDTVDRTTDGTGCVGDMTVFELQLLDAAFGTSMAGGGFVIPTLEDVLFATATDVNIEIKINDSAACPASNKPQLAADVVAAIQADTNDRTLFVSSFDADVLTEVETLDASIYSGLLTTVPDDAPIAAARGFDAINVLSLTVRDQQTVDELIAMDLDVNVWTENNEFAMQDMIEFGVNMVITDEPDVFITARQTWCDLQDDGNGGGCSTSRSPSSWLALGLALLLATRPRRR